MKKLILIIVLLITNSLYSATKTWTGSGGDGKWTTATNWNNSTLPSSSDDVILDNTNVSGSYTVTLDGASAQTVKSIQVGYTGNTSTITLVVSGTTLNLLTLNGGGSTAINVLDGGVLSNQSTSGTRGILLSKSSDVFTMSGTGKYIHVTTTLGSAIPQLTSGTTSSNYNFATTSVFENQSGIAASFDANPVYGNYTLNHTGTNSANKNLTINGDLNIELGIYNVTTSGTNTLTVAGNVSISSGATLQGSSTTGSATITISGNISGTGTLKGNAASGGIANITVEGDLTSLISLSTGTNYILFSGGTASVSFTPASGSTVQNLTIGNNKTVTLGANIVISGTLTLSGGNISTGSNTLTLGSSASSTGTLSRASGTIIGNFERWFATGTNSNFIFPVGTASNYRPVTISTASVTTGGKILVTHTDGTDGTDLSSSLNDGGYTIDRRSNMYWTLTGTTIAGGTYDLSLDANGQSGISDAASLRIIHSSNGSTFDLQGTHSAGSGTVVNRTGISVGTFNRFYIASQKAVNPLPVELTSFTLNVIGNKVELNWKTATEVNNYGFSIERSAVSGQPNANSWTKIGFVEGNGNSNSPRSYSFTDEPTGGKEFNYRLKQIDNDGTYEYSGIITAALENVSAFVLEQNYPNPFNPTTMISYTIPERVNVKLKIYDMIAQQVAELVNTSQEAGHYQVTFDCSDLPSGVYFYKLEAGNFVEVKKFMLVK